MTEPPTSGEARPRWGRRLGASVIVLALATPWWAPPLLRRLDFFRVRHVEVRGWRFSQPSQLVAQLGLDSSFSVWDDLSPLQERLRKDPQIESLRISRRLPSTLVMHVVERDPVAFVPSSNGLRAYDAKGRLLPFDPSRTPVDLPIIARRDTALLRLLADLKTGVPKLFARVSEVQRAARDEFVLQLVSLGPPDTLVPVRIMIDVSMDRLAQISSVERDLAQRRARLKELDLRFKDQVIARLQ